MNSKDQIQMLVNAAEKQSAELLKSAKSDFDSINKQVWSVRDNGEFHAGPTPEAQISALGAAASFLESYARSARTRLDEAERQLKLAATLKTVLEEME